MQSTSLLQQLPVTLREWALFGMRWIPPLTMLLFLVGTADLQSTQTTILLVASVVGIVSNLIVLLLLWSGRWSMLATILLIALDVLLVTIGYVLDGVVCRVSRSGSGTFGGDVLWLAAGSGGGSSIHSYHLFSGICDVG